MSLFLKDRWNFVLCLQLHKIILSFVSLSFDKKAIKHWSMVTIDKLHYVKKFLEPKYPDLKKKKICNTYDCV